MTTANSAWSTRRRRSSSDGKNDPDRSFGIRSSRSPAWVVRVLGRVPLRTAERPSVRCHRSAPITAAASASINSWYSFSVANRIRSPTSAAFSASSISTGQTGP